jgi:hypothetical protein
MEYLLQSPDRAARLKPDNHPGGTVDTPVMPTTDYEVSEQRFGILYYLGFYNGVK